MNGLALAAVGISNVVVQGFLIGRFMRRLGEERALLLGLAFGSIGFLIPAVVPGSHAIWLSVPFSALAGFYGPAAQKLMSERVPPTHQGQLQGALGSVMGVTAIIAPPLYTGLFSSAVARRGETIPLGVPFYVAALLFLFAIAAARRTIATGRA
jgi:DHA1 family tetracycline resistance protein-like MFS transporter